jgi:hypothetical protein
LEDLGLICGGELGLEATVAAGTVHVEKVEREGQLGLLGCEECRPGGFAHDRQERRVFLLISYLI